MRIRFEVQRGFFEQTSSQPRRRIRCGNTSCMLGAEQLGHFNKPGVMYTVAGLVTIRGDSLVSRQFSMAIHRNLRCLCGRLEPHHLTLKDDEKK